MDMVERVQPAPPAPRRRVTPVRYAPPRSYQLDVELVGASELRTRIAHVEHRGIERVDFHCLVYVTAGRYTHMVDFETFSCTAGSCLIIQPGQVHRFGDEQHWNGWLLVFRSELLQPLHPSTPNGDPELLCVEALPTHIRTSGTTRAAFIEALERMTIDAALAGDVNLSNTLLRNQFLVLITRLHLAHGAAAPNECVEPRIVERYREFRNTAEHEFRRWHAVAPYARHIGCSVKSLNRATREVADVTAKEMLVARLVLEAKRLLAHTALPISAISDQLGFDEPTNFVKFFRRETNTTPGQFRTLRNNT